jgi:hypothetical protein
MATILNHPGHDVEKIQCLGVLHSTYAIVLAG